MKLSLHSTMLPPTATQIMVTNLLTPYVIRICEATHYNQRLDHVNKQLLNKRNVFRGPGKRVAAKIGDAVIARGKLDEAVDSPGWLCRGYISGIHPSQDAYNILLMDYGVCIVSRREDFALCSGDEVSEKHLSKTVGLCNVLPTSVHPADDTLIVSREWSASAIEYARQLIRASDTIYFDGLAMAPNGTCYGEFYLNVQDNVIRLSHALVLNDHAMYLQPDVVKSLKDPAIREKLATNGSNDEISYRFSVSNAFDSGNQEWREDDESRVKRGKLKKETRVYAELERNKEKVLICAREKIAPVDSTLDAKFPAQIHKAWRGLVKRSEPRKIQSYVWPAMKNGLDVIAIGAAKSGKTVGYAFAICGLLAANSNLPQGINPSALILCSCSSDVLQVTSLCREFLQSYPTIRSVGAIYGKSDRSLAAEMFNGCEILISTPRYLARFMNQNKKLLHFKDLRYLVLDDGDVILEKYFDSVSQLFKKHKAIHNRELKENRLEIVITATHWTERLKRVATILMDNPCICVASFIEASIFKSVRPRMCVVNSNGKPRKLSELLGEEYLKRRTMVVCRNSEEVNALNAFLEERKDTLLAHEDMNFTRLQDIRHYWNACINGSYPILICTDEILSDLNVTNIDHLIHYSVPLHSKTRFNYRFSALFDSLQMESCTCNVSIIMDESNDIQLLHMIKILQRINVVIPPNVAENIKLVTAALEKKKTNYPICDSVKSWGFCNAPTFCPFRHKIIWKLDEPLTEIRVNDRVKFRVVSVHDATHFSARIISYFESATSEEREFSNTEYMRVTVEIQRFYSVMENRRRCETVDVGCVCGLEEPIDSFKRVEILRVQREEDTGIPKRVDVRCIDNGVILTNVQVYQLLHVPEELARYPMQSIEVYLVGLAAHDEEYAWNDRATDAVHQWFRENFNDDCYAIGTVKLHLRNTIWVDTLEVGSKVVGYKDLIGCSLRSQLLSEEYAVESGQHLRKMYELCEEAGIPIANLTR